MAKVKFSLSVAPTFKCKVMIPIPGAQPEPIEFTFKGRNREQFKEFVATLKDREDGDVILDIASGWDLEDAFGKESIEELTLNYMGAARVIIEKYLSELTAARLGN